MKKNTFLRFQSGYSILEVLITIVVASFALLALAGMLMKGIQFNNSSLLRSIAAQQAYDLADRMRANVTGLRDGRYDTITPAGSDATATCTVCTSACTSTQIAEYDACTWKQQNARLLPLGKGEVSKSGVTYSIVVSWDDSRSGTADKSFTLKVEP